MPGHQTGETFATGLATGWATIGDCSKVIVGFGVDMLDDGKIIDLLRSAREEDIPEGAALNGRHGLFFPPPFFFNINSITITENF